MHRHNRFRASIAVAGIAVAGFALRGATVAQARGSAPAPVTCHSGDIIEGTVGTVTVPSDNYCEILRARVFGNVVAESGAVQLGIDNSWISGSVMSTGTTDNGWICGSSVLHDVKISGSAANPDTTNSPGYWAIGDPAWCTSNLDTVTANYVGDILYFNGNRDGAVIENNDIERNLACSRNAPAPTGSGNAVDGLATGQCRSLGGGSDTDTNSPPDSD